MGEIQSNVCDEANRPRCLEVEDEMSIDECNVEGTRNTSNWGIATKNLKKRIVVYD